MKIAGIQRVEVIVKEDANLDTVCYRGSAPLAHLALLSQADVFDQESNREGLQRDLSPKHASEAYEYVKRPIEPDRPRAFPEVVINVRDKKVIEMEPIDWRLDGQTESAAPEAKLYRLRFDLSKMTGSKVSVSRVDGNHRLEYGAGDERRQPLMASVPFQVHIGLTRDQERSLFVDINANQKGLNSSHLAILQGRLTPDEMEIRDHRDRWIAKRLVEDPLSPWHGLVHLGGSKKSAKQQGLVRYVNFASLQTGVGKTLSKSQYIHDLTDPNAQYVVMRNYWTAVKRVFAEQWATPKDYLLLKNIGVLSLSILGGTIIDRCFARERYTVEDMANYLEQVSNRFDWDKDAASGDKAVTGMSGNQAALIIAGELSNELRDETGERVMHDLQEKLLSKDE
jgi:DGQHR domain-containing protein